MLNGVLAMAANAPAGQQPSAGFGGAPVVVMILIFIIFYFLLIRPQQKQQKKLQDMRANLKKGDKVITIGGIYGVILGITDDVVSLQIADKVKIDVTKSSIATKREEGT
ncbi:MAG: preprotein translocase subunit YajC [bacterium]